MSAPSEEEVQQQQSISNPVVLEKYKKAAEIANNVLQSVIKSCAPGKKVNQICTEGDKMIVDATSKIYNKDKKMEKGVAFPTCISVNHIVGHYSPSAEADSTELKEGDLVKVDLGVHIDGFIAVVAHTFVLSSSDAPITGRQAEAIHAANYGAEAALKLLKPGNKNYQVSEILHKLTNDFKVSCVQGVLSHQLERFNIDGEKVILNRIDPEHKVDDVEFEVGDVWTIDIVVSTGEGKPKETGDERITVYKRVPDRVYQLKMQASRAVFSEILKRFPVFPFNIRDVEAKAARFAVKECVQHDLLQPFPVLQEKEGEYVAHVKYTVLITENGPVRITGIPFDSIAKKYQSELKVVNEDVKQVLNSSTKIGAAADKKKKKPAKKEETA